MEHKIVRRSNQMPPYKYADKLSVYSKIPKRRRPLWEDGTPSLLRYFTINERCGDSPPWSLLTAIRVWFIFKTLDVV